MNMTPSSLPLNANPNPDLEMSDYQIHDLKQEPSIFSELLNHEIFKLIGELALGYEMQICLVGGAVRDYCLDKTVSEDLDFLVIHPMPHPSLPDRGNGFTETLKAEHIARTFADTVGGSYVLLDPTFGIHRVVLQVPQNQTQEPLENLNYQTPGLDSAEPSGPSPSHSWTFDFCDALENSLEKDFARRDLTFNAMAVDVVTGTFYDPFGGEKDLAEKRIHLISPINFEEDPLRVLRVFRLAAQLGTQHITDETLGAVKRFYPGLASVAVERIHAEFLKLLNAPNAYPVLVQMGEIGLLEEIFPEMVPMREVPPNGHHHLGLFDHTLELVHQVEDLFPTLSPSFQKWVNRPFNGAYSRMSLIKMACLFHDIGKPATMVQISQGQVSEVQTSENSTEPSKTEISSPLTSEASASARTVTFHGHDVVSETMTHTLCQRLKLSGDMASFIKKLVRWHLYPCQFQLNSPRKSLLRFFRRIGEDTPDLLLLALADRFSTRGVDITEAMLEASYQQHIGLFELYEAELANLKRPPLLNGHQVMETLRIQPGPQIKEIQEALIEAAQLGEIQTPEEAIDWLKAQYSGELP
ncbi:MAG: HD domain-containing protein [Cyanobacteria bacterium]|nr:HD domain-containing protein [Cyanobacteriota bacterium]